MYMFKTNQPKETMTQINDKMDQAIINDDFDQIENIALDPNYAYVKCSQFNIFTGKLTFINPANILNECNLKSPFVRNYSVEPKDGDLFIWPAWIPHKVDRNESDRQRINLAFNINIT